MMNKKADDAAFSARLLGWCDAFLLSNYVALTFEREKGKRSIVKMI